MNNNAHLNGIPCNRSMPFYCLLPLILQVTFIHSKKTICLIFAMRSLMKTLLLLFMVMIILMVTVNSVWVLQERYQKETCSGVLSAATITYFNKCIPDEKCTTIEMNNITQYMHLECDIIDRYSYAEKAFGTFNYIVVEDYATKGCNDLRLTTILPSSEKCVDSTLYGRLSMVSLLHSNGSVRLSLYNENGCKGNEFMNFDLNIDDISIGKCVQDYYKIYTSTSGSLLSGTGFVAGKSDSTDTQESGFSSNWTWLPIVGFVLGAIALGCTLAVFFWKRQAANDERRNGCSSCSDTGCNMYSTLHNRPKSFAISTRTKSSYLKDSREQRNISYFWDDDKLAAERVDRDKIDFGHVISHGGYGQVMSGWFNGQHVAIKMLLPENRKIMAHLTSFLEEVKLMSTLEHPRIVPFIGVAWDSLSDLCLLTEFMEGGDLRALLSFYEAQKAPVGFNKKKVTIALHIAHALTYLHSLDPPVLHRDLKSKNVLLTANLDAKLSDFGASRELDEYTMTAGVGTSLWMAPEVMMGEEYNEKADVFSMGVVLSELDFHTLPYSNAVEVKNQNRNIASAAIVHLVATGKLRVEFSSAGSRLMAELGLSCVALNPDDRPTAAEVLYKLHTILTREFSSSS